MRIFSFNTTHDASVCSLVDGELEFFCKEERLSRKKRDGFPILSINKYLDVIQDPIDHTLFLCPTNIPENASIYKKLFAKSGYNKLKDCENFSGLTHHQCHAMLAYINSGFDDCLVFVIDRNGSSFFINETQVARESETIYKFTKKTFLEIVRKNFWLRPSQINNKQYIGQTIKNFYQSENIFVDSCFSIVKVYEAATTLIGQGQFENGKTMGLSSYGNCLNLNLFNDGIPNADVFDHLDVNNDNSKVTFKDKNFLITENITPQNFQFYADVAKTVQVQTQEEVLRLIEQYVKITGIKNVCIVGGYGLNVVANNFFIQNRPDINFYFEPNSDDTGVSIGACFLKYKMITGKNSRPLKNTFYQYYEKEKLKDGVGKTCNIHGVVEQLKNQKSVGVFNGNPEAGPRALGHRSILFDPRVKNGKDIVNKIKKREWYRPFAGVILEEFFDDWFYTLGIKNSSNMTVNFFAKEKTKNFVPAIVHIDGSCRIQTVNINDGELFFILTEFYKQTGCPMLLNTSLNLAGEPLTQTKEDALKVLENSSLDFLYFCGENVLVTNHSPL